MYNNNINKKYYPQSKIISFNYQTITNHYNHNHINSYNKQYKNNVKMPTVRFNYRNEINNNTN